MFRRIKSFASSGLKILQTLPWFGITCEHIFISCVWVALYFWTMRGTLWCLLLVVVIGANSTKNVPSRLPRTSAGQLAAAAAAQNKTIYQLRNSKSNGTLTATIGPPPGRGASNRARWAAVMIIIMLRKVSQKAWNNFYAQKLFAIIIITLLVWR